MKFIDLFAGIGGFRRGMELAGHECVGFCKLTPKECFRLQGWADEYYERAALVNSDTQLYKQAGNGVTVTVIKAIAEKMK